MPSSAGISYRSDLAELTPGQLMGGFFEGWPNPPSAATHLAILRGSSHVVFACHGGRVVGFVNAISDGVLAAYIPLLEVLPAFRGRGVGTELVRRLLDQLAELYLVDVMCDPELVPFYQRLGLRPTVGLGRRNYTAAAFAR